MVTNTESSSIALYPKTDGQTKKSFQNRQKKLRCFPNNAQGECDNYFLELKFTHNNHTNGAGKHKLFFIAYEEDPFYFL